MLIETLSRTLTSKCLLTSDMPLLVGVSGGPDSLCLLHSLWSLGFRPVVAHLDHGLRPESPADADQVRQIAEKFDLQVCTARQDVRELSDVESLSLEEAARLARYRFLFEQAQRYGAQAVAVGHTANDQVETVLMHMLRGSGLSGLKGMLYRSLPNAWSQTIPLVRPLLSVWREEVLTYLREHGLQPSLDYTNLDTRFYRNRLRHELIPYLESYNPQARLLIWRMADVLSQEDAMLEQVIADTWYTCLRDAGPGYLALDAATLSAQPEGAQRRLLRLAIQQLRPALRDVDYAAILRGVADIQRPVEGAQQEVIAGLYLLTEGEVIWLAERRAELPPGRWQGVPWPQLPPDGELQLAIPGRVDLPGGWRLSADCHPADQALQERARTNTDPYQAWLDEASLAQYGSLSEGISTLTLRRPLPGDRFQPLGMAGHSLKLSDFFVNEKLPRRARAAWPLVVTAGRIAWAPGLRLVDPFRLTEQSQRVVHLQLSHQTE